jgi:Ca2+-binding RTX toxin-like protein
MRLRVLLVSFAVFVSVLSAPPSLATMTTCSYLSEQKQVSMVVSFIRDIRMFVTKTGDFKWEDTESGETFDCQAATVENTDGVVISDFTNLNDNPEIILDLKRRWGPGFTPEKTGRSEIEVDVNDQGKNGAGHDTVMILGNRRPNVYVFGASGFNLNADNDGDDVQFPVGTIEELYVKGREKADRLSVRGGSGTGGEFTTDSVTLQGDDGGDTLKGASGDENLRGLDGNDDMFGAAGTDRLFSDDGADLLEGGRGDDELDGMRGNDRMRGQKGPDDLEGGPGDDDLEGGAGIDTCSGGPGADSITGCEA